MRLLLLKSANQLGLFDQPTFVDGYTRKDGVVVAPHVATRKHRAAEPAAPAAPAPARKGPLDTFIARHGGEAHLRATLSDMTRDQRAKLVEAMAGLGRVPASTIIARLGLAAEADPPPPAAAEAAPAQEAVPAPEPAAQPTSDTEPGELTPPPEPDGEFDVIEDREDLRDAMVRDPHSEETRALIARVAAAAGDDLDPNSPTYRYRDTGYVAGSRKELAATMIKRMAKAGQHVRATDIDWSALESNPREAREMVTKANLFGAVDWRALRDAGMDPGAAFLLSRVYAAVPAKPEDAPGARQDYAVAIDTLRDRLEATRSPDELLAALVEIRAERDGEALNEDETARYAASRSAYNDALSGVRALEKTRDGLVERARAAAGELAKQQRELEQRKRRGWGKKPELDTLVDQLQTEHDALWAESKAFADANGMTAIVHRSERAGSVTSRFEYPYKADLERALATVQAIKAAAHLRNAAENPLTRAWSALGSGFSAVLDYRGYKGSDAFAKHVASVRAGRVADWTWAETGREVKGATKRSTTFQLQVADDFERVGGPEVAVDSTEALKRAFNLREVQSGNWVLDDPNSAKFHVESCAGALADLADLLGVPPEQVSFNGRLAMAFGARGKGGAKAHYEPVQRVINITKMAGGGSLAHEWFHCVDNLAKEATGNEPSTAEDFATEAPGSIPDPELSAAFAALTSAMTEGPYRRTETLTYTEAEGRWAKHNMAVLSGRAAAAIKAARNGQDAADAITRLYEAGALGTPEKKRTRSTFANWRKIALIHHDTGADRTVQYAVGRGSSAFLQDAAELDQGEAGKYWSSVREMGARAFSGYVQDRLASANRSNTYLASQADNDAYLRQGLPYRPFPAGEERARINAAFDRLFGLMRDRQVLAKALAIAA